ncbi:MAG: hypothetical protein ABUL60_27370 [Myxococcales bacterium]
MARRAFIPTALAFAVLATTPGARAQEALDPAAAREHLTQGYKLKQQGNLREALPHLVESLRLDPKLKTTINLADCEEKLGMLVEAQSHWLMARDRAGREGDDRVKQEAEQRLSSLGTRMPRLNIQFAPGVPADAQVYRDEVLLGRVSLGTALPTNPGEHKISVRAPGHEDSKYSVKLSERDSKTLTVDVGAVSKTPPKPAPEAVAAPAVAPVDSSTPQTAPVAATAPAPHDTPEPVQASGSAGTVQRVFGAVVGGLGLASFGVSGLFWRKASNDIKVEPNGRKLAQDDLLITNVGLVAGSVLVTGGIVLLLTAPSSSSRSASAPGLLQPSLLLGKSTAVLGASGRF